MCDGWGASCATIALQVGEQELTETICATLLSLWKFRKFTESRWLTVGTRCRVLMAGLATGLDDLVQSIQKECRAEPEGPLV